VSIAFFDLDKTLIAQNSALLWILRQWREGGAGGYACGFQALGWLFRYSLGWAGSSATPLLQVLGGFAGVPETEVLARTKRFYEEEVRRLYRPGGLEALERERREGRLCILLTSSTQYLGDLVAEDLGLDGCLANTLEADAQGRLTGQVKGVVCYGRGKLLKAEAQLEALDATMEACSFYTDSYADISVLEAVGTPVAVNPDIRLKRWAKAHHCPIVDWGS